jgi:hypothetical protein
MADLEQNTNKVQAGVKMDPELFAIVDQFRAEEDRSMSNMIERLLKTHPRIQEVLEAEPASVAAN